MSPRVLVPRGGPSSVTRKWLWLVSATATCGLEPHLRACFQNCRVFNAQAKDTGCMHESQGDVVCMHSSVTVARMTRYDCLLEEQVGRGRRRGGRREAAKAGGREGGMEGGQGGAGNTRGGNTAQ